MRPLAALPLLALIAACRAEPAADEAAAPAQVEAPATAEPAVTPAAPTAQAEPKLAIDAEGLRLFDAVTGAARPIAFGTPRAAVLAGLAFRGAPSGTGRLEECGAGPLDTARWDDGLTLYFQGDKFLGWALGGDDTRKVTTAAGIGLGSTRAELESAYNAKVQESTLGTEFAAGELFGILDGTGANAKITHLWGGTSCNMR